LPKLVLKVDLVSILKEFLKISFNLLEQSYSGKVRSRKHYTSPNLVSKGETSLNSPELSKKLRERCRNQILGAQEIRFTSHGEGKGGSSKDRWEAMALVI
jgi:hypothetical protein